MRSGIWRRSESRHGETGPIMPLIVRFLAGQAKIGLSLTAPDDVTDSLYGEEDPVCILPGIWGLCRIGRAGLA